jgi:bifunctional non-homologous end joining protein LigD
MERREPGGRIQPMLATTGQMPADDSAWAYEMKWDGIRAIAVAEAGAVTLHGRSGRDMTASYPELQALAGAAGGRPVTLDGEIVAFGPDGWPSFESLQQRMNLTAPSQVRRRAAEIPATYLAFDLLVIDGERLTSLTYEQRRSRLDALGLHGPSWQAPPAFIGVPGADVRALSARHGLEGIMAKRLASRYEAGRRSSSWLKIKNTCRQEFVVGGWKPGLGERSDLIGSLLLGVQGQEGLTYVGHVGTGFTLATLRMISARLAPLRRDTSPFGETVPPEHARGAVWAEPTVVIEAEFARWTESGRLRAASYQGLRPDKDPAEVIREPTTS